MKSLKESQSFDVVSGKEFSHDVRVRTPESYAEDAAFLKHLETKMDKVSKDEIRKLYRIATTGLSVRFKVDKAMARLRVWEHEKTQSGTINNGLKYGEIFKRGRELLETIREG